MKYFMILIKVFIILLIATFFVVPIGNLLEDSIWRSFIFASVITVIDLVIEKSDEYER